MSFSYLNGTLLKAGCCYHNCFVGGRISGFGNKRVYFLGRHGFAVVFTLHHGEILVEAMLKANGYIKLSSLNRLASLHSRTLLLSHVNSCDDSLKHLPFLV